MHHELHKPEVIIIAREWYLGSDPLLSLKNIIYNLWLERNKKMHAVYSSEHVSMELGSFVCIIVNNLWEVYSKDDMKK